MQAIGLSFTPDDERTLPRYILGHGHMTAHGGCFFKVMDIGAAGASKEGAEPPDHAKTQKYKKAVVASNLKGADDQPAPS